MVSFNLIDEPWIPVRVEGEVVWYSLEQTLLNAEHIERIADNSPLAIVVFHRLLLAILYRALKGPENMEELEDWLSEGFPKEAIRAYLAKYHDRFDIFDTQRPFMQVPDLDKAIFFKKPIQPKSWVELSLEHKDGGNSTYLFSHESEIPLPCDVRNVIKYLLIRQGFSLAKLSRTFETTARQAPSASAMCFIPFGTNLLYTLCNCLTPNNYIHYVYDIPFWETDEPFSLKNLQQSTEAQVMGCVQAYTWMTRAVKLIPERVDGKYQVENIYFTSGLRPLFRIEQYFDPMVSIVPVQNKTNKAVYTFRKFQEGRGFWRDFPSLFAGQVGFIPPQVIDIAISNLKYLSNDIDIGVFGLKGNVKAKAKVDYTRQEYYRLPAALKADRYGDVFTVFERSLALAENVGKALNSAARALAQHLLSHGGEREPSEGDVSSMVRSFPTLTAYWSALDRAFAALLERLEVDFNPNEVQDFWREQVRQTRNEAWRLTRLAAGDDASALRAIYIGENKLYQESNKYLKEQK